jgi:hypothetical protein
MIDSDLLGSAGGRLAPTDNADGDPQDVYYAGVLGEMIQG